MSESTPIPTTYDTGTAREERFREHYEPAVKQWLRDQLLAAGVDFVSYTIEQGGMVRLVYGHMLNLRLLDVVALQGQDLATAPRPIFVPLSSGAGHAEYWTRAAQQDLGRLAARLYVDAVQAIDLMWEQVQASAALMLDATRTLADRTAAWETVQRLHLPRGVPSLPSRRRPTSLPTAGCTPIGSGPSASAVSAGWSAPRAGPAAARRSPPPSASRP